MNDEEVQVQQREVQRLLGRCLLRLQQYERLMKAIVAHSDLSGPAHALEEIRAPRVDEAFTKTPNSFEAGLRTWIRPGVRQRRSHIPMPAGTS